MKDYNRVVSRRCHPCLWAIVLTMVLSSVSQAQIKLDGSLGPATTLGGPNFTIPADLGQVRGGNLFHSFAMFNVLTGQSATFTGPSSISNILGRVTGGQPSTINGLLRSEIAGANLYLLNPAGVLFGANAQLDVKGSFHIGTADYLKFADGAKFHAELARQSVLTTAAVSAFGFLSGNPAGVSIQGNTLQMPQGQTLSIVGGSVEVNNSLVRAPGGRINLASVASPGEVTPVGAGTAADLLVDGVSRFGNVNISQSTLSTSGAALTTDPAGAIVIRGGQILVRDSSLNAIGNPGGLLRVGADQIGLSNALVNTGSRGGIHHAGTAVDIALNGLMTMSNGSEIASSSSAAGRAGGIRIQAGSIVLGDDDPSSSTFSASGFYGDIGSRAFAGGRGGDVQITAGDLTIKNGFFINTAALNLGDAGNVTVRAGRVTILDGASISSNGFGLGRGGIVDIETGQAFISARNINSVPNCNCFTGIAAQTGFGSPGGALRIKADRLELRDGGRVSTILFSSGPGANVDITAKELIISGVVFQTSANPTDVHSSIDARLVGTFASGTGGNIHVVADSIEVKDGGFISSSLFDGAPGKAGSITLDAARIELRERGFVGANSLFGTGSSGTITVNADSLVIAGVAGSVAPFTSDFTGLSTTTGVGAKAGGDIHLNLGSAEVNDKGSIASVTLGPSAAGNIHMQLSGDLNVTGGATINSSAFGSGRGGTIDIGARNVVVTGVGQFNGATDVGISGIAAQTGLNGGNAGNIRITTGSLQVLDGAAITTDTFGAGGAGNIEITANNVLVSGVNQSLGQNLSSIGIDPRLAGAHISSGSSGLFLANSATGDAGQIRVAAHHLTLANGARIATESDTPGQAGSIDLTASKIVLLNGATITSKSSGSGDAGNITVQAGEFRSVNSSVTTEAESADGGNIHFKVNALVELVNSEMTAEVKSGIGSGGNITIDPTFVILNDSQITANAFGGPGGNVTIVADVFLASPLSNVTASSALSTQGTVDIQAPVTSLSGTLAPLPETLLQTTSLMNQSCAARFSGGLVSSLTLAGRDGAPWEPGWLMPSPLFRLDQKQIAMERSGVIESPLRMAARSLSLAKPAMAGNSPCFK